MYDSVWNKSVWIPFWILQLVAAAIFLVLSALGLGFWKDYSDDIDDDYSYSYSSNYEKQSDRLDRAVYIVSGVYIGISALTLVLNGVEIILFARKRLSPVIAVVVNCITTAIWLGMLLLLALAAVEGGTSVFSWIVIIVAFATSIGKLAYGATILHRYRRRFTHRGGAYTSASSAADPEFASNEPNTAYNAGGSAAGPLRHSLFSGGQHPSGTAGDYYDPESIRGYAVAPKASTRYA